MRPVSVNIFFNCFTPTPNCSNNSLTPPLYLPVPTIYENPISSVNSSNHPRQIRETQTENKKVHRHSLSVFFFFFFFQFLVIQINQIQIAPEQRTPFVFSLCLSFILPTATTTTTSLTLCCVWCPIKCLWLPLLLFQFRLLSLILSLALFNAPSFSLPLGPFLTRPDPPHSLSIPAPSLGFHLHPLISLSSFSALANPKVLSLSLSDSTIFVAFDL